MTPPRYRHVPVPEQHDSYLTLALEVALIGKLAQIMYFYANSWKVR